MKNSFEQTDGLNQLSLRYVTMMGAYELYGICKQITSGSATIIYALKIFSRICFISMIYDEECKGGPKWDLDDKLNVNILKMF